MVKALVVYYSLFGNTEKIAKALAEGLQTGGIDSEAIKVDLVEIDELSNVDLLCVGSPTHGWSASKPIKEFLERLKRVEGLRDKKAFAFDTKMKSRLAGSAGDNIEKELKNLGFIVVKPSESAIVKGREGPLEEGSEEKFKQLGSELAQRVLLGISGAN